MPDRRLRAAKDLFNAAIKNQEQNERMTFEIAKLLDMPPAAVRDALWNRCPNQLFQTKIPLGVEAPQQASSKAFDPQLLELLKARGLGRKPI